MTDEIITFTASIEDEDERIDKVLTNYFENISRSYIQKMIKDGNAYANDKVIKANYRLREGDIIRCCIPACTEPEIEPEDIPLDILYEDCDILIVNKPKNMVVHPSAGHYSHTLAFYFIVMDSFPVSMVFFVPASYIELIKIPQVLLLSVKMKRHITILPSS